MTKRCFSGVIWALAWILALSPAGYAAGLYAEEAALQVGDTVTVHYAADSPVERVGAITLYLSYDASVLQTESIQTQTDSLLAGDGDISCMAADDAESGTITGSWTETDCAMTLKEGTELMSVTFRVTGPIQESQISSRIILKGMAADDSFGNDDLGAQERSVLVLTGAGIVQETDAGSVEGDQTSVSGALAEKEASASWFLPVVVLMLAGIAGAAAWFMVKRKNSDNV